VRVASGLHEGGIWVASGLFKYHFNTTVLQGYFKAVLRDMLKATIRNMSKAYFKG